MGTDHKTTVHIMVKLSPRSSRNQIIGKEGDYYKIKVTTPPVGGKANKSLINLLSKKLGVPKGSIEIISGKGSRLKSILINGIPQNEATRLLEES